MSDRLPLGNPGDIIFRAEGKPVDVKPAKKTPPRQKKYRALPTSAGVGALDVAKTIEAVQDAALDPEWIIEAQADEAIAAARERLERLSEMRKLKKK